MWDGRRVWYKEETESGRGIRNVPLGLRVRSGIVQPGEGRDVGWRGMTRRQILEKEGQSLATDMCGS